MITALDTNVLIYAHFPSFPEHERVRRRLQGILSQAQHRVAVTVGVLSELVHVVTDSRRFSTPLSVPDAVGLARSYMSRTNVAILPTDEVDLDNALRLMEQFRLGRGRLSDTLLAATLQRNGVSRLLTRNLRDYQVFGFLIVEDPLDQG